MNSSRRFRPLRLPLCAFVAWLLAPPGAPAGNTAYRWTDAEGRVHFSDTRPGAGAVLITPMELPLGKGTDAENERYSIQNQLERTEAWRAHREQSRPEVGNGTERNRRESRVSREPTPHRQPRNRASWPNERGFSPYYGPYPGDHPAYWPIYPDHRRWWGYPTQRTETPPGRLHLPR